MSRKDKKKKINNFMTYVFRPTKAFKKDFKKLEKQGKDLDKLHAVIEMLCNKTPLPEQYDDHKFSGSYKGYTNVRECHIESDWVLIYKIYQSELVIIGIASGSHSETKITRGIHSSLNLEE